jgi:hypothetical protein
MGWFHRKSQLIGALTRYVQYHIDTSRVRPTYLPPCTSVASGRLQHVGLAYYWVEGIIIRNLGEDILTENTTPQRLFFRLL